MWSKRQGLGPDPIRGMDGREQATGEGMCGRGIPQVGCGPKGECWRVTCEGGTGSPYLVQMAARTARVVPAGEPGTPNSEQFSPERTHYPQIRERYPQAASATMSA